MRKAVKPINLILTLCLFFAVFAAIFSFDTFADGYTVMVEWPGGTFDKGETIDIEISIIGLATGKVVNGGITAEVTGLELSLIEAAPGFEIHPNYTPGVIVVEFSSNAGYISTQAGKAVICMLRCRIGEDAETRLKVQGTVSVAGMTEMTPQSIFTVNRVPAPTEKPTSTPKPTPTPGPDETAAPTFTPTPSPTMAPTDPPTPTPTPTMVAGETPLPTSTETAQETSISDNTPFQTSDAIKPVDVPGGTDRKTADPIPYGAVVFWAIVALVAGIWVGIGIGAIIWKRKSIFVSDAERKVIGKK